MGEGPVQQKALIGPEDTTRFTGGFDLFLKISLLNEQIKNMAYEISLLKKEIGNQNE